MVVVEILLGPQVFDIAKTDSFIEFFANLGFGMLFFFTGYEIDFQRIKGRPIELGGIGWLLSAGLAYGIGGVSPRPGSSTPSSTPVRRWRWRRRRSAR